MSENALEQVGGFDLLLTQNVEHIWERIFLSLDYESLRNCLHVCRAWWEIFRRESFRAKMVAKFPTEMWMDTENMERKIWRSRRKILAWTANSEEVAFVEEKYICQRIYLISQTGSLISRKLKGTSAGRVVESIWILRHIILVKTDTKLYAITKLGLEQSTIESFSTHRGIRGWASHFSPTFGVRFSYYISDKVFPPPHDFHTERGHVFVGEVPFDYSQKSDFSTDFHGYYHHDYYKHDFKLGFNGDGTRLFCHVVDSGNVGSDLLEEDFFESGLICYAIDSDKCGVEITELWDDNHSINIRYTNVWRANSNIVAYVDGMELCVHDVSDVDVDDCEPFHFHNFWIDGLDLSDYCVVLHDIMLTERNIFALYSYWKGRMKKDVVFTLDLESQVAKHAVGNATYVDEKRIPTYPPMSWFQIVKPPHPFTVHHKNVRISWGDHNVKINEGRNGICSYNDQGQLLILDLSQGDPEKFLMGRRIITSRAAKGKNCSVGVESVIEIKQGMCLFEARRKIGARKSENFTLELISWQGEQLPKALEKWSHWLHRS